MTVAEILLVVLGLFVVTAPAHGVFLLRALKNRLTVEQFEFVVTRKLKVGSIILFPSGPWMATEGGPSEYISRPLGSSATVQVVEESSSYLRIAFVHKPHVSGWVYRSVAENRELIPIACLAYFYALPLAFWRSVVLRIPAREVARG